ncbi:MAG TPA: methylmalonyl-CoA mutase subunit beta [Microvirga sp.]|jgi:methylmalonyl-CoA mutase
MDDLSLAADFPQASREQWLKLVEGVLKGAEFDKRLVARSPDGLRIEPLYPKAEGAVPVARQEPGRWRVTQRVDHPDPAVANELALADLEGGADSLALVLAGAPTARGFGLAVSGADAIDRALQGVMLDLIHLRVETAPFAGREAASSIADLVRHRGLDPASLSIDFGLDPLGDIARTGAPPLPFADLAGRASDIAADLRARGFRSPVLRVDTRAYHEAGAGEAQELAAALATGLAYLRALEPAHGVEAARDALTFLLVADADEFLTVAKFRAMRRLWARIEEASGLPSQPIRLQAETAWRMTTRRDPWVNLLRTTVATFSAGIGGADGLTVLPFTAALGLPDAFARRLARNTQTILLDESNLWRVPDPAAGAGGFEALTEGLCERAWALFQEIEREGGLAASLAGGAFQARIAAVAAQRERAVATRKEPITGTSEFPNIHEAVVEVLQPGPISETVGNGLALPSRRSAEPFERLRDAADAYTMQMGERPKVFLANLGPVAAFTARATFARNFFESAGIEAVTNDGFASLDEMLNSYSSSKAKLSCICSSDEIYEQQAIPAIEGLRNVSKSPIYIARRPGELEEAMRRAGATTFIFAGCDTLSILSEALEAAHA